MLNFHPVQKLNAHARTKICYLTLPENKLMHIWKFTVLPVHYCLCWLSLFLLISLFSFSKSNSLNLNLLLVIKIAFAYILVIKKLLTVISIR